MANVVPSCYRSPVVHLEHRVRMLLALTAVVGGGACSRTGFGDLADLRAGPPGPGDFVDARGGVVAEGGAASMQNDSAPPPTAEPPPLTSPPGASGGTPTSSPRCVGHVEECNGEDDDCNGRIDDGIPPRPCAHGGQQYCVAGRLSACPSRCDACVPGSERICFHSYCTFWAAESCTADGKSFGACRERRVPPECAAVASAHQDSPELERCCIDNGYCCHDEFDLDGDGNRNEMLGTCDEVSCSP
jgi:hypothetical protein